MKIAPLRERLSFQIRQIVQDEIGNETSTWIPLFERWCSCRPLTLTEKRWECDETGTRESPVHPQV